MRNSDTRHGPIDKSTNVRIVRHGFQALNLAAPAVAERAAAYLFTVTMGSRRPRPPVVNGVKAHAFTIDTGLHRLAAWDYGDGPTVLLVHGWNGRAAQMSSFIRPLVNAGYYVVAFDLPGHGASTGRSVTVLDMADAIVAAGRRLGPVSAVIAHSLGGTATALALTRGLQAERAVLVAPPAEPVFFARGLTKLLGLPEERLLGMLGHLSRRLGSELDALDVRRLAEHMSTKLLVAHDPEDADVPFAHGAGIAEAWPGAELLEIRGLGHHAPLKNSELIGRAVEFVRRVSDGARPALAS